MGNCVLVFLFGMLLFSKASAATQPVTNNADPRIKTVTYNERGVVVLKGHYGYSTHVIFAEDEKITFITAGDSLAWQIVPTGHHLFLKPVEREASTNLSVLTDRRSYHFELHATESRDSDSADMVFQVQFVYPEDELAATLEKIQEEALQEEVSEIVPGRMIEAEKMNFNYSMRGAEAVAPIRIFDDGEFTYFQFDPKTDIPAIFLVDSEQRESILNFHVRGHYVVVQRTARQFMLRDQHRIACIYNEDFTESKTPTQLLQQGERPQSVVRRRS